jgi:AcrR family transcriptional regulator
MRQAMPVLTTREKIVNTALDTFYQKGFHAVGIDVVIKKVGITKTTFYNHFESKDDLILEVIRQRDTWWRETFQSEIRRLGGDDPVRQLRAVFEVLRIWFEWVDFKGCLFISAVSEFPNKHDPAHQAALANVDAIRAILTDLAEQAGIEDPQEFAQQFNLIIEGAIVTEVIDRNNQAAQTAARLAQTLIDSCLPTATNPRKSSWRTH